MELIFRQFSIFTKEKKCDCIRSDMTSSAEIIGSVDKISYFDFFLYLLHNIKGIFIGVCMGNTDNLLFRIYNIIADQIYESV